MQHTAPIMTPLRHLAILLFPLLLGACTTLPNGATNPQDPFESFNRTMYKFNDDADKAIVKPVAQAYNKVMPVPARSMVGNFFSNLDDMLTVVNDVLQLKLVRAFTDTGRVLINTTIGIGGLVDAASQVGYEKHSEDFGQTLGYWGIGPGPYLVLPLLGPSNVRDGLSLYVDSQTSATHQVKHIPTRNQLTAGRMLNKRAQLLDQEKTLDDMMLDRYAFIRDAYLQHRLSLVYDGNPPREKFDFEDDDLGDDGSDGAAAPQATPPPPATQP
jgi:phospholipid-binding lipoprotein MlaA